MLIPSWLRRKLKKFLLERKYPGLCLDNSCFVDTKSRFGLNVRIGRNAVINDCTIADYSYINSNSVLQNADVGKFCSISSQVLIGLGDHPASGILTTSPYFFSATPPNPKTTSFADHDYYRVHRRTRIGNDVWIGAHVYIRDGLSIGDGAIVAAGAVVTKDVAPYSIVGGVPAKELRQRFAPEDIAFLLDQRWWDRPPDWLRTHFQALHSIAALRSLCASRVDSRE